jgi:hypothetical protein
MLIFRYKWNFASGLISLNDAFVGVAGEGLWFLGNPGHNNTILETM